MKTSIQTLFAAALTLVVLTSSAFASTEVTTNNVTVLSQIKNINKIEVKGNVELLLVQSTTESVKVYDSYYSKNALVQKKDGVLRISSFQKEKLTVAVYVRELTSIDIADNASVKTFGKISFVGLTLNLKDSASADIKANTISLTTSVKDNATLKLSGTTTEHYALLGSKAKMSMEQFAAENTSVNTIAPVYAKASAKSTLATLVMMDDITVAK